MPFDKTSLSMERVNMINSIRSIRDKFNLDAQTFFSILEMITTTRNLPGNTNKHEDVLFENAVQLLKHENLDLCSWIGGKIGKLIQESGVEKEVGLRVTKEVLEIYHKDKSPFSLFNMYCNMDEKLFNIQSSEDFTSTIPQVSVISVLKEMIINV